MAGSRAAGFRLRTAVVLGALAALAAVAGLLLTEACEATTTAKAPSGCTKLLTGGKRLQPFVRRLKRAQVGCLDGTFHVDLLTIRHSGFKLTSAPGRRATIDGIVYFARSAHNVVLSRLALDGANGDATPSIQINGRHITLNGDEITNDHSAICVLVGSDFERYGRAGGVIINRNRIHGCGRLPRTGHDHGIYVEGADRTQITNNLIYDNADYGIQLYPDADRSYIADNVLDGNGGGLVFAGEQAGGEYHKTYSSDRNLVVHNIISNSVVRYGIESYWPDRVGVGNVAGSNCFWNNALGPVDTSEGGFSVSGSVEADPLFVNVGAKNFALLPASPCKAMGPLR